MFDRAIRAEERGAVRAAARWVFRTDLVRPGFAHLALGKTFVPGLFHDLVDGLAEEYRREFGRALHSIPQGSFDQQVTTGAHRDGGPEDSVLVLGYEPTTVASRLLLLDFTKAAIDEGMTPAEFLARHNPICKEGRSRLDRYVTELTEFDPAGTHVVVINNGIRPWTERHTGMLGVLHEGIIPRPDPAARRMIHSVMLAPLAAERQL